jgi:hypothetical protein
MSILTFIIGFILGFLAAGFIFAKGFADWYNV